MILTIEYHEDILPGSRSKSAKYVNACRNGLNETKSEL
jgi:hypothetical protein